MSSISHIYLRNVAECWPCDPQISYFNLVGVKPWILWIKWSFPLFILELFVTTQFLIMHCCAVFLVSSLVHVLTLRHVFRLTLGLNLSLIWRVKDSFTLSVTHFAATFLEKSVFYCAVDCVIGCSTFRALSIVTTFKGLQKLSIFIFLKNNFYFYLTTSSNFMSKRRTVKT